jgi:hypothetical protein
MTNEAWASRNGSDHTGFPNDVESRATEPRENVDRSYGGLGSQRVQGWVCRPRVAMHRIAGRVYKLNEYVAKLMEKGHGISTRVWTRGQFKESTRVLPFRGIWG